MKKIYIDKEKKYFVLAGSFIQNYEYLKNHKDNFFTLNLTSEYPEFISDYHLPINDFSIPKNFDRLDNGIKLIIDNLLENNNKIIDNTQGNNFNNKIIAFGCLGGIGRTGLLLGLLYNIFDYCEDEELIKTVRENLHPQALETPEQINFVLSYNTTPLKDYLKDKLNEIEIKNASTEEDFQKIAIKIIDKQKFVGPVDYNFLNIINKYKKNDLLNYLINNNIITNFNNNENNYKI